MKTKVHPNELENAPLVYTLAQIRFSAILSMENNIPEIQERLRSIYPRYNQSVFHGITISKSGIPESGPQEKRWEFNNKENDTGCILQNSSFVFHTTKYKVFTEFSKHLFEAINIINDVVGIGLVERIGMRHIDVVIPNKDENISGYLSESLIGFPTDKFNAEPISATTHTAATTGQGKLFLYCHQNNEGAVLPNELVPCPLTIQKKVPKDRITAIVDTDHFIEGLNLDFNPNELSGILDDLHIPLSNVFKTIFKNHAYEQWK